MSFFGTYLEVTAPSRLVWTNEEDDGGTVVTTASFEDDGGRTRLVIHDRYPSKAAFDAAISSGATNWNDETFEYRTALLRNDGASGSGGFLFVEVDAGFAPTMHAQSQWADFDGDQDLDLLLTHLAPLTDDGFIRRYRNDGGGVFTGEDILGTLSVEHGEAQWGDYDGDGDLDVLVAGNLREMLMDVDAVGNDLVFRGASASPTIRIKRMTVSGS